MAYAWTQEALTEQAQELHTLGRELHERLATMGGHLDRLGRSLGSAVAAYNKTIGSLETRVLVSARKFADLQVTDAPVESPETVTDSPRPLTAAELLDAVAGERAELPFPATGDSTGAGEDRRPA